MEVPTSSEIFEGEDSEKIDPATLKPELYEAAKANKTEEIIRLLDEGVPPTFIDATNNWTALHWAAVYGNVPIIRHLIKHGASKEYHKALKRVIAKEKKEIADINYQNIRRASSKKWDINTVLEEESGDNVPAVDDDDADSNATTIDFLKNTPLLWAAFKGHLRAVWVLLLDDYSPNDVDDMGNNALHLAAVNKHQRVLRVLIDDGAAANKVNFYKNRPVDVASTKEMREMLLVAMQKSASYTRGDVAACHADNLKNYNRISTALARAVAVAKRSEDVQYLVCEMNLTDVIDALSDALADAVDWAVDEEQIDEGKEMVKRLEVGQDFVADFKIMQRVAPVRTQEDYSRYVQRLQNSISRLLDVGFERVQLQFALDLVARTASEYWLETLVFKLKDLHCPKDSDEHDISRLQAAVEKASALSSSTGIISNATALYSRLSCELRLNRAVRGVPSVRLPIENPPEGYWQESDVGMLLENAEAPSALTPEGYIWMKSESFAAFAAAYETLKVACVDSEGLEMNQSLFAEAKEKLKLVDKDMKLLDAKDASDKQMAIANAIKLAKKMKKKGGKKK